MKWSFKWRKELETGQYQDLVERGIISKPEDQEPGVEGFEFYLDAFRELSTSRPVGFEIQAIPFTAIAEYFRIYELSDFDEFLYLMRLMDSSLLKLNEESKKSEGKKDAARNPNKKNRNKR